MFPRIARSILVSETTLLRPLIATHYYTERMRDFP